MHKQLFFVAGRLYFAGWICSVTVSHYEQHMFRPRQDVPSGPMQHRTITPLRIGVDLVTERTKTSEDIGPCHTKFWP